MEETQPRMPPPSRTAGRRGLPVLTALLAAALLWAPLPAGSVTPGAALTLRLVSFAGLAIAVLSRPVSGKLAPVAVPAAALAALGLLGGLQSLAWPGSLVGVVSPEHLRLRRQAVSMGLEDGPARLSLAPEASRAAALGWASAAAALAAAAAAGGRRRRRRWLIAPLVLAAALQVLFGLPAWLVGSVPRLRGTYVNPDHLALLIESALAVAAAAGWWVVVNRRRLSDSETRVLVMGGLGLTWALLVAGLVVTGSRAGLVAAAGGMVAQAALIGWRSRSLSPVWALGAAGLAGLGVLAAVGWQQGLGRWLGTSLHDVAASERLRVWHLAAGLWRKFPWTGSGLGSFPEAFAAVQPPEMAGFVWGDAHNDLLELAVTGGAAGLGLALAGVAFLARRLTAVARHGRRSEDRAAAVAALGALAAAAIHELFDFGLKIPANAFSLAVLAGAAAAAPLRSASRRVAARPVPAPRSGRRADRSRAGADRV